jgi:hypothetical protein
MGLCRVWCRIHSKSVAKTFQENDEPRHTRRQLYENTTFSIVFPCSGAFQLGKFSNVLPFFRARYPEYLRAWARLTCPTQGLNGRANDTCEAAKKECSSEVLTALLCPPCLKVMVFHVRTIRSHDPCGSICCGLEVLQNVITIRFLFGTQWGSRSAGEPGEVSSLAARQGHRFPFCKEVGLLQKGRGKYRPKDRIEWQMSIETKSSRHNLRQFAPAYCRSPRGGGCVKQQLHSGAFPNL